MSLWPANDEVTASLMADFYRKLAEGQPKDLALQQAKLAHLQTADGLRAQPFYWGAFVAVGEMDPLKRSGGEWIWWILLAVVSASFAGRSGWRLLKTRRGNTV